MSFTPASPDDVQKLLDNGWTVALRTCGLGSYYAVAVKKGTDASVILNDAIDRCIGWDEQTPLMSDDGREFGDEMEGVVETDDFSPSQVLYRITEKATTGRIVGCDEPEEEETEDDA